MTEEMTPAERVALAVLGWRDRGYRPMDIALVREAVEKAYPRSFEEEPSSATVELLAAYDGDPEDFAGDTEPFWNLGTWAEVVPGDRVRLGGVEADVKLRYLGEWFAQIDSKRMDSGVWWDTIKAWRHFEVKVMLQMDGQPEKSYTLPPAGEVEILCDAERTAALLLQKEFGAPSEWPTEAGEWNRKALAADGQPNTAALHRAAAERIGPRERGSIWTKPGQEPKP